MIRHKLIQVLEQAVFEAQQEGLLPAVALPEITIEHPQNAAHGDYASNFALKFSRAAQSNPLEIATKVASLIPSMPEIVEVRVGHPGFINLVLSKEWLVQQVEAILEAGETWSTLDIGKGSRVQLEFVSVNPTGPLHVGHGRGAVLGSTLANVLATAGYEVEREYYINDAGSQMKSFFNSVFLRYQQCMGLKVEMPADSYKGDYVTILTREIAQEVGDKIMLLPPDEAATKVGEIAVERIMNSIKADLRLSRVDFDVWFSESSLYKDGQYEKVMALLQKQGCTVEKEGAVWFASSALGEDKDNVLVRRDGTPTYFASDTAYHYNKFKERNFDRVINIWGADHQGHVPRMKAVVNTLGISPERLQIIITQMVTLKKGHEEVKISKRSGEMVTLREVIEEVGTDACRFFFLSRSADSQMEFDLELAKKQSAENPVYYVQYAHARIASILRLAEERQIDYSSGDVSLLISEPELLLIRKMLQLPELIESIAHNLEASLLPRYAQEFATTFHDFYERCRVISDNEALTLARLKLVTAAKIVLARTLHLMSMESPERM